jgi:hypothetical protein
LQKRSFALLDIFKRRFGYCWTKVKVALELVKIDRNQNLADFGLSGSF